MKNALLQYYRSLLRGPVEDLQIGNLVFTTTCPTIDKSGKGAPREAVWGSSPIDDYLETPGWQKVLAALQTSIATKMDQRAEAYIRGEENDLFEAAERDRGDLPPDAPLPEDLP